MTTESLMTRNCGELLDALRSRTLESKGQPSTSGAMAAYIVARRSVEVFVGELEAEITARGKLYGEMCGVLHECCQKYRLGLGGENIAELVTEEVARLRQGVMSDRNK